MRARNLIRCCFIRFVSVAAALIVLSAPSLGAAAEAVCGFDRGDPDHGAALYAQACSACHGADGRGVIPGAPDLTKSGGVLSQAHDVILDRIENGYSTAGSPIAMPPRGGDPNLSDEDIEDIVADMYDEFGCG